MAIYHMHVKSFSRTQGHSAVAAAAYRSGEKLLDERATDLSEEHQPIFRDYTGKADIFHNEIIAPDHAPDWVHDRETLWNEVEKTEKRKDAQLAREVEVALPRELDTQTNIDLVHSYVQSEFVSKGMIADIGFHDHYARDGQGQPHAHIMLTMREISEEGFGLKNRDWNGYSATKFIHSETGKKAGGDNANVVAWRESWATHVNNYLESAGANDRIDHRTLEAQGIDRIPEIHIGARAMALEEDGFITRQGERWRQIQIDNTNREARQTNQRETVQKDVEGRSAKKRTQERERTKKRHREDPESAIGTKREGERDDR